MAENEFRKEKHRVPFWIIGIMVIVIVVLITAPQVYFIYTNLVSPTETRVINIYNGNSYEKEMVIGANRAIDRSLYIMNSASSMMSAFIGLIAIIIAIAAGSGVFEFIRWKELREKNQKEIDEKLDKKTHDSDRRLDEKLEAFDKRLKIIMKETEEKADVILKLLRQKLDEIGEELPKEGISLGAEPTIEVGKNLDEFAKNFEAFRNVGGTPTAEDYINYGYDLYYKKDRDGALKAYGEAIKLKPDYAEAWSNKGVVLKDLDKKEDALKAYDEAIRLKPDYAVARSNKGVVLKDLNKREDALKAYDEAIKLKPDFAHAYFNRACVFALMSDKEGMIKELAKSIDLDKRLKSKAQKDNDFKAYLDDPDFKKLVE